MSLSSLFPALRTLLRKVRASVQNAAVASFKADRRVKTRVLPVTWSMGSPFPVISSYAYITIAKYSYLTIC